MITNLSDYYLRWYHARPVAITSTRREELKSLHKIIYRCAEFLSSNYKDYLKWIPLGERDLEILEYQEQYPFRAGTWRPDYIIGADGDLRICEITSRFFAHGIFMSRFAEQAADRFMARYPGEKRDSDYPALMEYMAGIAMGKNKVYVLKSSDRTNEIRLYKEFYEGLGLPMTILESEEVESRRAEWASEKVLLLSALNQNDILSFGMDTIKAMADSGMWSDFRNIFLLHDKRFMRLWFEDDFTSRFLTAEEALFLRSHSIPTWDCSDPEAIDILKDARKNKDKYILKPYRLGKSEGVKAGVLTNEEDWEELSSDGMIIQPFIKQRTFRTAWEGQTFDDYMCGMMLCVDDRFFGSGLFRASSLPVTNIGDDRKACPLLTDNPVILEDCDVL